jgi:ferric-dicitrate binding protein FerR (iron transport regulator)
MDDQIYNILVKYFTGDELNSHEEKVFSDWKSHAVNSEVFDEVKAVWETTGKVTFPEEPNIDEEWNRFLKLKENQIPVKTMPVQRIMWAAASIIIAIGLFASFFFSGVKSDIQVASNNLNKEVILPDGSAIMLSKNTTLVYNKKYGQKNRKVRLEGEAFFKVTPNKNLLFEVYTKGDIVTKVLGTSFNLRALVSENAIQLSVLTGKVAFGKVNNKQLPIFVKDQQAEINIETGELTKSEWFNSNKLSWRTQKLVFDNIPLSEVIKTCSVYFEIEIILPSKFDKLKFSGKFNKPTVEEFAKIIDATFNISHKIIDGRLEFSETVK